MSDHFLTRHESPEIPGHRARRRQGQGRSSDVGPGRLTGSAKSIAAVACLASLLFACEDPSAVVPIAPPHDPPPPRPDPVAAADGVAIPETYIQLDLLHALQERILELEIEIAEHNQSHIRNRFEDFLLLDPWTLGADQVFFLKHFCDNGDFTLPREAEVMLLERELTRRRGEAPLTASPTDGAAGAPRPSVQERLDSAIARNEQRVADLERIAELYRTTTKDQITYPETIQPDALETERRYVSERLDAIRGQILELDARIAELLEALAATPDRP